MREKKPLKELQLVLPAHETPVDKLTWVFLIPWPKLPFYITCYVFLFPVEAIEGLLFYCATSLCLEMFLRYLKKQEVMCKLNGCLWLLVVF